MSRENDYPKRLAAADGIQELVGNYFAKTGNKRLFNDLNSKVVDLVWEAVLEQDERSMFWLEPGIPYLGNLYFAHFCSDECGISDSAGRIADCLLRHGKRRGLHFFMEKALFPLAAKGNVKAIDMLVRLVSLNDDGTNKLAEDFIIRAFARNPASGPGFIGAIKKHIGKNHRLIYLSKRIDPAWTFALCEKWMDVPYAENDRRSLHAVAAVSDIELSRERLESLINNLRGFWERAEWRRETEVRQPYYSIILKGFRAGILDEKAAMELFGGLFEYGYTCDLCGRNNALEILQEIAKDGYVDVLYNGFLVSASSKKGKGDIRCSLRDKQIKSFLDGLDKASRRRFLIGAVLNATDMDFLWLALQELAQYPADEEIEGVFKEALNTKDGEKIFYLGQFYFKIRFERSFEKLKNKWSGLADFLIERLKREEDPELIYQISRPIVYWGSKDEIAFVIPFLEKAMDMANTHFSEMVMLALACHARINETRKTCREADKKRENNEDIFLKSFARLYRSRGKELLGIMYKIIEKDIRDVRTSEVLAFPAIAFISHLKLSDSVPRIAKMIMNRCVGGDLVISVNTACAGFLKQMALKGDKKAIKALAKIPENPTYIWPAPTAILAEIFLESKNEEVRKMAIDLASQRMFDTLAGRAEYIHTEIESINPVKAEAAIQEKLLSGLESGLTGEIPMGISRAIEKLPDLILPENRERALEILKSALPQVGRELSRTHCLHGERLHQLENVILHAFEAIRKLEKMKKKAR